MASSAKVEEAFFVRVAHTAPLDPIFSLVERERVLRKLVPLNLSATATLANPANSPHRPSPQKCCARLDLSACRDGGI